MLGIVTRRYKRSIAVSGTHGKTTTTAMLSQILIGSGFDPSAIIGGKLPFIGGDKFVKFVREGESYIVETQTGNADMSVEYLYTDKYGVAILVNGKLGKYTITG